MLAITAPNSSVRPAPFIALPEYEGAIMNPNGLNEEEVFQHRKKTGSILNFPVPPTWQRNTDAPNWLCDILIPAALENVINGENAPRVKAKIIGEAANGPCTRKPMRSSPKMASLCVPDMYLNAGGVTVSYFEWLKTLATCVMAVWKNVLPKIRTARSSLRSKA